MFAIIGGLAGFQPESVSKEARLLRVACVLITHLRAKVELLRQPDLRDRPAVIVERSTGRPLVVDVFPAAPHTHAGMALEEALSRHTDMAIVEADEPSYQRVFRQALTALQGVSDRVEGAELGTAYARLDGLETLYGGEDRIAAALLDSVPEHLAPRVGVADAKFPAFVAARTSRPLQVAWVPSDAAAFLASHSIDLLPVSSDVTAAMRRFGLRIMGDVSSMKRDLLLDQFGRAGGSAWDFSRGDDDRPLVPLAHEEAVIERVSLPFSSSSMEFLMTAVDTLLKRAYSQPLMRGRYAGRTALECVLERASPWRKTFHFKQGIGDWERASTVIRGQLQADHPQAPVEEASLTLTGLTGESGAQMGLLPDLRKDRERRLAETERQLQARVGGGHVLHRVASVAPWHPAPEMRALQVPVDPTGADAIRPLAAPTLVTVREGLEREPVAALLGKRWRRVARIEDRWCFDLWWLPKRLTRAYYRVTWEDEGQATLFRDQQGLCWYQQDS